MKYIKLDDGRNIPVIGQGCGNIENKDRLSEEDILVHKRNILIGINCGLTLLDTAEIYGNGMSESIIGSLGKNIKKELFIATKFSPNKCKGSEIIESAEKSLKRLKIECIDLYQVHWPNNTIDIEETMNAMLKLKNDGKIKNIGVCNFSQKEITKAKSCLNTINLFSNQSEYNTFDIYAEKNIFEILEKINSIFISYSPLDKGRIGHNKTSKSTIKYLCQKYGCSPGQLVLNWMATKAKLIAIPQSMKKENIESNGSATDFEIEKNDLNLIDRKCTNQPTLIETNKIWVTMQGEGNKKVYQSIKEARDNKLELSPSPVELSEYIKYNDNIKPIRLVYSKRFEYKYELIEGRLRYWAWVIAYNNQRPIPALIRE